MWVLQLFVHVGCCKPYYLVSALCSLCLQDEAQHSNALLCAAKTAHGICVLQEEVENALLVNTYILVCGIAVCRVEKPTTLR
jgi:hypothetical protein